MQPTARAIHRRPANRGVAIIMVIAFYAIVVTMIGVWVQSALDRQRQLRQWQEKSQAAWLAEAGVRRAAARLARQPDYTGEVWKIEADELGSAESAEVTIEVETNDEEAEAEIVAIATFPAGEKKRVQHTKSLQVRLPATVEDSGESS